jgi:E3 ubiquitin-protein ligase ZNF598
VLDTANEATEPQPQPQVKAPAFKNRAQEQGGDADDDTEVCFICASNIDHRSITPCNHDTCHICALRMRALYKDKNCPHCRVSAPWGIQ